MFIIILECSLDVTVHGSLIIHFFSETIIWNFFKNSVTYWLKLISLPARRMSFCGYDRKTSKSGYFREYRLYSWSICIDTFSISYFKCQEKFHYQLFLIYNLYDMVTYCSSPVPHSSSSPWLVLPLEIIFFIKKLRWSILISWNEQRIRTIFIKSIYFIVHMLWY